MNSSKLIVALLFFASSVVAQSFPEISSAQRLKNLQHPKEKVDMVFDTDTYNEIDDQFALVYALLSQERFNVKAVYAAPFHNKRSSGPEEGMELSYEEILRLLDRLEIEPEGLVFKGSRGFLKDASTPQESEAARDLVEKAKQYSPENPLYVVAVGAITNVSSAILMEPEIIKNIVVVWLGGAGHHWHSATEFNFSQDLHASRLIFDCGVPLVQIPCTPVVTHFHTTVPEMEAYLAGKGNTAKYLLQIFKEYSDDHFGWSKVLWDMVAIAWLINDEWTPTNVVHSPVITDNHTYSTDKSRHFIKYMYHVHRDPIFRDFFTKLEKAK
ncbi:MAG: nucleoside hydrolase [Bacteroidota bacterium]